jgi:hypothetical protein
MADLSFTLAMSIADTARRNRCVPILVTPAPVFGTNLEAEEYRQCNRTDLVPLRDTVATCWTLTLFGALERRPVSIGANMIGRSDALCIGNRSGQVTSGGWHTESSPTSPIRAL